MALLFSKARTQGRADNFHFADCPQGIKRRSAFLSGGKFKHAGQR